ncbi:MAG: tetratricopeptide repeat protein [Pseudomonadota bacterium]
MAHTCPQCGSDKLRGAKLHAYDGIRRIALFTPLRCRDCHHRFWVFSPLKPVLLLGAGAGLVAATAWLAAPQQTVRPADTGFTQVPHERAAQGDADAQLALAMRYAEGDGVIKNENEAARWFERAAQQGNLEAQYRYGLALLQGRGVVQDYKAAFEWIHKTAQRGYAPAQYSLGELYRFGTGTAVDKPRAYLWFNLAAAQGVEAAAKARDSLVMQLKPEQVTAMQDEARKMSGAAPITPTAVATHPQPQPAAH